MRLALLRLACWPLSEDCPRRRLLWRVWLRLMEARYVAAETARGREYARRYDYIPF